MPKYSIIIPVCDNLDLTKRCITSINLNTTDYEIIVIDNGSFPAYEGLEIVRHNEKNEGFPVAVNQGIKIAKGEVIVILNNDVVVTPHWLDRLSYHFCHADIVGPMTNEVSGAQKITTDTADYFLAPDEFANSYYTKNSLSFSTTARLVFFCVAIKRKVIDKIGLLDEQFTPGNFEDDDFCLRAIEADFKLAIAKDVFVYHLGSATHKTLKIDFVNLMAINKGKFEKKWSAAKIDMLHRKAVRLGSENLFNPESPLSLAMIVKNEAVGLENAILSCWGLVSDIVIAIDKTTTDETADIAKKYGARIKYFDFLDDFAAARNFAQEGVKTEWTLFLDGHEYLKQAPKLLDILKQDCDGLLCTVVMENGAQFRSARIFKSHLKFAGQIHEQPQCVNPLPCIKVVIQHDRNESQSVTSAEARERQRNYQMPEIMGILLKDNPKNTRASFHLVLYYMGRFMFKEAKKCRKLFLKHSKVAGDRWFIYFNQALGFLSQHKFFWAYLSACSADRETPGRWEVEKLKGMIFFSQRNYRRALSFFVKSMHENTCDVRFKPWQVDLAGTWNLIGESFFQLGNFEEAGEAFNRASERANTDVSRDFLKRRSALMFKIKVG
ncbi:MAG: hypothetical protein A2Y67_03835 [Candidatus Buchananbacteria bacterium RBG_13_39_9]|uniref:Glycosyltransferase 2-like domain-containing protein n=1 Tax=Candidatus Buchananbacteria bacterium RBG_13_39_9 TaxID=1797531 RepID=A0A1G1XP98_9BACT|nr:MAG: hypothetical protein A2Y67_03835 [Candidatus Buchananbacteria bacterium RBG_13_39_9]